MAESVEMKPIKPVMIAKFFSQAESPLRVLRAMHPLTLGSMVMKFMTTMLTDPRHDDLQLSQKSLVDKFSQSALPQPEDWVVPRTLVTIIFNPIQISMFSELDFP
jgi:hypothetical protein